MQKIKELEIKELENQERRLRTQIDQKFINNTFDSINISDEIGRGSYNSIHSAEYTLLEQKMPPLVASFTFNNSNPQNAKEKEHALKLMAKVEYSPFIQFTLGQNGKLIFSERGNTDLDFHLRGKGETPLEKNKATGELREILGQIILGLEHLHLRNILHRDFKTENILVFYRLINLDKDTTVIVPHVKLCDFDTAQEVDDNGQLLWKEATPKGTGIVSSDRLKKIFATVLNGTYDESKKAEYYKLNHFIEEFFNFGTLIRDILPHFMNSDDAKPLLPLMKQHLEQDADKFLSEIKINPEYEKDSNKLVKSIYDRIKSNEFFGKTPDLRKNFFTNLLQKFKGLDNSFKTSALMAQSKKKVVDYEQKILDSVTLESSVDKVSNEKNKNKVETFEKLITRKTSIIHIIDTQLVLKSTHENGDFEPDTINLVILAWETVKNKYSYLISILKNPDKGSHQNSSVEEALQSLNNAKANLMKEIKDLSTNDTTVYDHYKDALALIEKWDVCVQNLKNKLLAASLSTSLAISPPPVPEQYLRKNSTSGKSPSTSDSQNSSPIRLPGLGGPPPRLLPPIPTVSYSPAQIPPSSLPQTLKNPVKPPLVPPSPPPTFIPSPVRLPGIGGRVPLRPALKPSKTLTSK